MKILIYTSILMSLLSFNFISCNNDYDNSRVQDFNGIYNGTFSVTYDNEETFSNPVAVTFNGENIYNSTGNDSRIPAGGSGIYEKDDATITFEDVNSWTANFDWNLILNGTYDYTLNENHLIISAHKNGVGLYTYDLITE